MAHDSVPELPPDATVRDAARALAAAGAHRAVVTTPAGDRAVVTPADVVQAVAEERRLGTTRALSVSRPADAATEQAGPFARLDAVLDLALAVVAAVSADGASVIVAAGTARRVAATSSDLEKVDQLQIDLDDGPALAAVASRAVEHVELRPSASRWPNYHRAALAHGMRRALCVPLVTENDALGALTLYWRDSGPHTPEVERVAELVARRTALAVISTGALDAPQAQPAPEEASPPAAESATDDAAADEPRDEVVTAAQGILRSRKQYSDDEAFATLRDASERTRRPLPDVAREVVDLPEYMRPKTR